MAAGKLVLVSRGKKQYANRKVRKMVNPNVRRMGQRNFNNPRPTSLTLKRGLGFPERYTTCLRFSEPFLVDTGGTGPVSRQYRGNGPRDPRVSTGGSDPDYWSQLAELYNHYTCWGSSIEVKVVSSDLSVATNPANIIAVIPQRGTLTFADMSTAITQPKCRYKYFRDNSDNVYTVKNSARTKQMLMTGPVGWTQNISAEVSTEPVDMWFWNIETGSAVIGADTKAQLQITIVYYITFQERKPL